MSPQTIVRIATAITIIAASSSLAGLFALNTGATIGPAHFGFGLTEGYEDAAYRLLSDKPDSGALRVARQKAENALELSPYQNTARLRLAYIDAIQAKRFDEDVLRRFERSYDLIPVDADVAAWRVRFGLENWGALSPKARNAVHEEAMAFWRLGSRDVDMNFVLTSVQNPNGRLAVALWLRAAQSSRR